MTSSLLCNETRLSINKEDTNLSASVHISGYFMDIKSIRRYVQIEYHFNNFELGFDYDISGGIQ